MNKTLKICLVVISIVFAFLIVMNIWIYSNPPSGLPARTARQFYTLLCIYLVGMIGPILVIIFGNKSKNNVIT